MNTSFMSYLALGPSVSVKRNFGGGGMCGLDENAMKRTRSQSIHEDEWPLQRNSFINNTMNQRAEIHQISNTLESFKLLNADDVTQVISFLDLPSIISLKSSCRTQYSLLNNTPQIWKHMYKLALKTVPTVSCIPLEASDDMIQEYKKQLKAIADRAWNIRMEKYYNVKLKPFRDMAQQGIEFTDDQDEFWDYNRILEEMANAYFNSEVVKKEYREYDTSLAAVSFYCDSKGHSLPRSTINIPGQMLVNHILDQNDLTASQRDQYITELIEARFGSLLTRS